MKILEIITESRILNEQLQWALKVLEPALASGDKVAIEKVLYNFGRLLVSSGSKTAELELAQVWMRLIESGIPIEEAIALGKAQAARAGVSSSVLKAAEKETRTVYAQPGMWDKIKQKFHIGGGKKPPKSFFGPKGDLVNNTLTYLGWGQAVLECAAEIQEAYDWYSRNPTPENFKGMQWDVQKAINTCFAKVLAIGVGNKLIKGLVGGEFGVKAIIPFTGGETITAGFRMAGSAAQTAFLAYLATPEGQRDLTKWLLGEILILGPQWEWLTNWLSGWVKSGYDAVLRHLNSPYAQQPRDTSKDVTAKDVDDIIRKGDPGEANQTRYDLGRGQALK